MTVDWNEAARRLSDNQIGVVPTDTLYGIVGSALSPKTVERIYDLRQRERDKALIVLIYELADLARFQIKVGNRTKMLLEKFWPGPVSVILPVASPELAYLHRGTGGIAFRMPAKPELRELLQRTGPLVAPSANLAGDEPAHTLEEAREYFADEVFYLQGGHVEGSASALVDARGSAPRILRPAPGFTLSE